MDELSLKQAKDILNTRRAIAIEKREIAENMCMQNATYKDLMQKLKINTLNLSKALANNESTAQYEQEDAKLHTLINELEQKIGVQQNYFHCKKCNDTGVLSNGKYCDCLIAEYKSILRQNSQSNALLDFNFCDNSIQNIDCNQSHILTKLYASMQKFCNDFPNTSYKNILISGKVGVGKTCLLSATCNALLDKGYTAVYYNAFDLNNLFLKYHTTDFKIRQHILDTVFDADILIIDDLGVEPIIKNVTIEYLLRTLQMRENKHTIIATNITLNELEDRYGQRVSSRIANADTTKFLYIDGDNLRLIKK